MCALIPAAAAVVVALIAALTVCFVCKRKPPGAGVITLQAVPAGAAVAVPVSHPMTGVALADIEMTSAADDKSKQFEEEEEMDEKI